MIPPAKNSISEISFLPFVLVMWWSMLLSVAARDGRYHPSKKPVSSLSPSML